MRILGAKRTSFFRKLMQEACCGSEMSFPNRRIVCGLLLRSSCGCAKFAEAELLVPIRNVDEVYSPFVVAKYLGYYSAEGLDVNILPVGGSNEAAIQVGAGNGDVGLASPPEAIVGLQRGALDIRYFYQVYYADIWKVAVPADSPITNLGDLRGKRIGVPVMGSAAVTYGKAYLTKAGLNPDTDVTFVPIGFGGQALAAAQQKMVDALLFYDVALVQFDLAGLKLRVIPTDREFDLLPDAGLLARNDTIQKRPKMLVGLGRAIAKGYDFTQANPAAAVKITWSLYPQLEETRTGSGRAQSRDRGQ